MKKTALRAALLLAAAATAACGATPPPIEAPPPRRDATSTPRPPATAAAADESFRKTPPAPGPEVVFVPPKIEESRLPNGIRVLLVQRRELPIVAVTIVMDRGADQAAPGVGGFAGAMLFQGTKTRSALQLSDDLARLGASYGAWVDFDGSGVRAQCLTPKLQSVFSILGDVVQNPAFDEAELKRMRSRRLTAIAQENDNPSVLLSKTMARGLYPEGHPYHGSLLGTEDAVKKISRADLARFHAEHFAPQHMTVAFAGDIDARTATAEVERVFGKWKGKERKAKVPGDPPAPAAKDLRVVVVDRPGATQSNVSVALPGVPRTSKDFDALTVMNTILGGQFSSRLNLNLREAHAYTYGARSGFDFRHGPGPFSAGGAIFRDKTDAAVREILSELDRLRKEPASDEELSDAKEYLVKQLPARFETAAETAATLGALSIYGLPLDEFATRPARFGRITKDDVRRVAETYLRPDRLRLFVVGDLGAVKEGLGKIGLGPVHAQMSAPAADAPKPDAKKPVAPAKPDATKPAAPAKPKP